LLDQDLDPNNLKSRIRIRTKIVWIATLAKRIYPYFPKDSIQQGCGTGAARCNKCNVASGLTAPVRSKSVFERASYNFLGRFRSNVSMFALMGIDNFKLP
jgi:hypothetical protein